MKTNKITKMMMIITMIALLSLSSLAIYGEGYNVVNLQGKNRGSMTTISGNLYDKEGHRMRVKTSIDVYCNNTKIGTTMSTPDDFSLSVKKDVCPVKSVVKVVIGDYTSNEATVRKVSSSQPLRLIVLAFYTKPRKLLILLINIIIFFIVFFKVEIKTRSYY